MISRMSDGTLWNHPSRKMLFLLVVLVVGALAVLSIILLLKSRDMQSTPQVPLLRPIVHLTLPEKDIPHPVFS